jgi:hypothetical protein
VSVPPTDTGSGESVFVSERSALSVTSRLRLPLPTALGRRCTVLGVVQPTAPSVMSTVHDAGVGCVTRAWSPVEGPPPEKKLKAEVPVPDEPAQVTSLRRMISVRVVPTGAIVVPLTEGVAQPAGLLATGYGTPITVPGFVW